MLDASRTSFAAEVAGRFARDALDGGEGEVCAVFRRSFYLRVPGPRHAGRFVCVGDASLGRGPLNALVDARLGKFRAPGLGETIRVATQGCRLWQPPVPGNTVGAADLAALREAARGRVPEEGLGGLILGSYNGLSIHAQPALEALDAWLAGNALAAQAEALIGLGPGLTPSGDDYFGGMLVALRACGRAAQGAALWRWLEPRLPVRTSAISAAHLAAAAEGEAHEALHLCIAELFRKSGAWSAVLSELDAVGHCSGWDALAGAAAVARTA
jgi:hypothetical protein